MNIHKLILTSLVALILVGCGSNSGPAAPGVQVAYEVGSKKKGDKAVCVICNAKEGTQEEETIVETLDYQGKTYAFCNESEKATFIAEPAKYAVKP